MIDTNLSLILFLFISAVQTCTAKSPTIPPLYQTTKVINEDSTITYLYTDKVDDSDSLVKQAMSSIMGITEDASNIKETNNIDLRLASMQDEDKSEITIDSDGRLSSYFRIRTTSRLDAQLKEENSFFNFEIRAIENDEKN